MNEFGSGGQGNGFALGILTGQDVDSLAAQLSYSLVAGAGDDDNAAFAIDSGGQVTVANALLLDHEQNASYSIRVRVEDQDGVASSFEKVFTGLVNDINPEFIIGDAAANHFVGGAQNDIFYGRGDADILTGGGGSDILVGDTGADSMTGGSGSDTYYVDEAGDQVFETDANPVTGGKDSVVAQTNYTIPTNVEALYMFGALLTGTGNGGNNTLLSVGGGPNTLEGMGGNDNYHVNNNLDIVTEAAGAAGGTDLVVAYVNFTKPLNVEALYMNGSGLIGTGNGGSDVFVSLGGPNTLIGLSANDTYYVNHTGDTVTEAALGGNDAVVASVTFTIPAEVEALYVKGSGLTAFGNAGNNVLLSLGGPNTLSGGAGNDGYYVNHTGDTVTENPGPANGNDTVTATVNFTIPDNVEALYVSGSGRTATGNADANTLISLGGPNTLQGLGGNDTYFVNNTSDTVTEAALGGKDTVYASATFTIGTNVEQLVLTGTGDINGTGSSGNNTIFGNTGDNVLSGAGGNDFFVEDHLFGIDRIADFNILSEAIAFDNAMFTDFNDLMNNTVDTVNGAVITFDVNNVLTLTGVTKAGMQAHPGDFYFI